MMCLLTALFLLLMLMAIIHISYSIFISATYGVTTGLTTCTIGGNLLEQYSLPGMFMM